MTKQFQSRWRAKKMSTPFVPARDLFLFWPLCISRATQTGGGGGGIMRTVLGTLGWSKTKGGNISSSNTTLSTNGSAPTLLPRKETK